MAFPIFVDFHCLIKLAGLGMQERIYTPADLLDHPEKYARKHGSVFFSIRAEVGHGEHQIAIIRVDAPDENDGGCRVKRFGCGVTTDIDGTIYVDNIATDRVFVNVLRPTLGRGGNFRYFDEQLRRSARTLLWGVDI